ncbi:MAG: SemiSWEET transporter [Vitreimonas sp.]
MPSHFIVNALGVAAGLCSMASFVPQLIKIAKEKDATGVSLHMFAITIAGFALWITYGGFEGAWPLIFSNGVCLILAAAIFILRLRYGDGGQN